MRELLVALLLAGTVAGCASGPPRIAAGTPCVRCGMGVAEMRFACESRRDGAWRTFDSIECLIDDRKPGEPAWLTDYDTRTLHPADSMWVVHGSFPSPMGGGYAAFLDAAAARDVAARTQGTVARLGT
jgi:nitrous oxide reductase accessory protein NosL